MWHAIIALAKNTQTDNIGLGLQKSPLNHIHGRTTSSVAGDFLPRNEHTVGGYRPWHSIIAIGQHKQGQTMSCVECHISLGQHTVSDDVKHAMPSLPLGNTQSQTKSGVAWHHCPLAAYTIELHRAWHATIALGQHRWSYDIRRVMLSSPMVSRHSEMTSSVALA